MYEKRNRQEKQRQLHMLSIDDLVPKNYILRDIDKAIDFSFIYDEVEGIYRCSFVRQKNEKRRKLKYQKWQTVASVKSSGGAEPRPYEAK